MKDTLLIQLLLIAGAAGLCLLLVRRWDRADTRAWKRLAFFAFVLVNVYAVIRPGDVTWVANRLGVGRGTDLVLYLLVLAVSFFALNTYLRFKSVERKLTDLARSVAIRDGLTLNQVRLGEAAGGQKRTEREEQPVP
jgi:hypothetical protein